MMFMMEEYGSSLKRRNYCQVQTITAKCGQKTLFDGLPFYRRKWQNTVDPIDGERFFTVS